MLSWRKTFRPYITTSVRETLPNVFGHFTPTLSSNSIEKQLHVLVPVPVDETQPAGTLLESCEKKAKNKKKSYLNPYEKATKQNLDCKREIQKKKKKGKAKFMKKEQNNKNDSRRGSNH